jgi:hypothetical protein
MSHLPWSISRQRRTESPIKPGHETLLNTIPFALNPFSKSCHPVLKTRLQYRRIEIIQNPLNYLEKFFSCFEWLLSQLPFEIREGPKARGCQMRWIRERDAIWMRFSAQQMLANLAAWGHIRLNIIRVASQLVITILFRSRGVSPYHREYVRYEITCTTFCPFGRPSSIWRPWGFRTTFHTCFGEPLTSGLGSAGANQIVSESVDKSNHASSSVIKYFYDWCFIDSSNCQSSSNFSIRASFSMPESVGKNIVDA